MFSNILLVVPVIWLICMLYTDASITRIERVAIFLMLYIAVVNGLIFIFAVKPGRYFISEEGVLDNRKTLEVSYCEICSIVLTIGFQGPYVKYEHLMKFVSPYMRIKQKNGTEYLPKLALYNCELSENKDEYKDEMHDYPTEDGLLWRIIPFSHEPTKTIIDKTLCDIYVTRSFLIYNQWSINRFAEEYGIDINRINLINDGMKDEKTYWFDNINIRKN